MTDFSLTDWLKALGPYQTIFLLVAFLPAVASWPSGVSQYLSPAYISLAIAFIGFFATKHNFSGPLRYGIAQYSPSLQGIYQKFPDGTIWILILLRAVVPWTLTWLVTVVSIGWQYTLQHFREAVRSATDSANNICARASIAAAQAQADITAVARYEADAIAAGATAARDARHADGIRASDFFGAAASAFAAVESAAEAVGLAQNYSATAVDQAERARSNYSSYSQAQEYERLTKDASGSVSAAYGHVRAAVNIVSDFSTARNADAAARKEIQDEDERVAKTIGKLLRRSSPLPGKVAKLVGEAQAVRHWAAQAVAKAEEGRTVEAAALMQRAMAEVERLEAEGKRIARVKGKIREILLTQLVPHASAEEEDDDDDDDDDDEDDD